MMGACTPRKAIGYGDIIPGSEFIRSLARQGTISKTAAVRLTWIDFHRSCQNVRLTCRHGPTGRRERNFMRFRTSS
jgi:hypothetical protein